MIVNPSPVSATPADMLDPAATVAPGTEGMVSVTSLAPTNEAMSDDAKRALWGDVALFASLFSAAVTLFGGRR